MTTLVQNLNPEERPFAVTGPLDGDGFYATRHLDDGHWLVVEPMTFQRARIGLSHARGETAIEALNRGFGYTEVWEYDSRETAIAVMNRFTTDDPDDGWTRHVTPTGKIERAR